MEPLTERQPQVLEFAEDHGRRSGFRPTLRQIGKAFGRHLWARGCAATTDLTLFDGLVATFLGEVPQQAGNTPTRRGRRSAAPGGAVVLGAAAMVAVRRCPARRHGGLPPQGSHAAHIDRSGQNL
jgi:hypothetical protein